MERADDDDEYDEPPEVLAVDKHTPHFMNLCGISWHGRVSKNFVWILFEYM